MAQPSTAQALTANARAVPAAREETLATLVQRAQNSDKVAFEALYNQRITAVSRYIGAILKDVDTAEDVASQTFLLAWKNLPTLRNTDQFDAWLFRIAHNQSMNEIKKRRPATALDDAPELIDNNRFSSPTEALDGKYDRSRVRTAMLHLSRDHREVLALRFLRELPHAEIAQQLGKSEEAIRSLQHRALKRLRQVLESQEDSPQNLDAAPITANRIG
jgi:RNA polymerase sigma-70 factor (ECF subfamily)